MDYNSYTYLIHINEEDHYCILSNTYQNNNEIYSGFTQVPTKYPQLPVILIGQI